MEKDRHVAAADLAERRQQLLVARQARSVHATGNPRWMDSQPVRSAAGPPIFSYATFRLLSPVLLPVLLSMACLGILLPLAFSAPDALAIGSDAIGAIFLVYAAVGVVQAAALAYAPSDVIWALVALIGLLLYGAITLWAVFGPTPAILTALGVAALLGAIIRRLQHQVLEHTVHVMVLFGKYHRTLSPGFNLRYPGEQVLTIVHTTEVMIEAAVHDVVLADGLHVDGHATACCRVIPEQAHDLAPRGNDWPEHLQRLLTLTMQDVLNELRREDLMAGDTLTCEPPEPLSRRLHGRLRQIIQGWGIHIVWVRAHDLRPSAAAFPATTQHLPQAAPPPRAAPPLLPDALVAALAEAYQAIRERRITDAGTIAQIADEFDAAARDPLRGPLLPFDASQAATLLRALITR